MPLTPALSPTIDRCLNSMSIVGERELFTPQPFALAFRVICTSSHHSRDSHAAPC